LIFVDPDGIYHYRIYTVGKDGHFTGPLEEVEYADDREIVATAFQRGASITSRAMDRNVTE
jgi:hypothetical protein